ncbi:MAG: hypothetical protein NTX33_01110 [Propionibacteriales bacterium]|nr:hypothetical protein [Propionibacteriales bacterium]
MPLPLPRWFIVALPLALVLAGCSRDRSYDDRDWSQIQPVAADIPQVREPGAAITRTNLGALDPCAVGAVGEAEAIATPGRGNTCTVNRSEGTVEVITDARYFSEGSGPDAINALDSRDRVEIADVVTWVGKGAVTSGGPSTGCAVVVPASLRLALAIVDAEEDCAAAQATAEAVLADLAAVTRPGRTVTEPVFYAVDEPDPGGVGGCAELGDQIEWLCAPVGEVDVPDDPVDLIRQGEADPRALCVPALESAQRSAASEGRSWVAVTTAVNPQELADRASYDGLRQCTLLEAQDRVGAASDPATVIVTARRQPLETNANTEVAGHPTYHSEQSGTWEVALTDPGDNGFLRIEVVDAQRQEPAWAEEFVADLVERVFD